MEPNCFQNDDVFSRHFGVGRRLRASSSPTECEGGVFGDLEGFTGHFLIVVQAKMPKVEAWNPAVRGRRSEVRGGKRKVGGGKKIKRAL